MVDDRATAIWSLFGNGIVPRNVIIDKDAVVRYTSIGFDKSAITTILAELLSANDPQLPGNRLIRNYPNPFNAGTQIDIQVDKGDQLSLNIYNIRGQLIRILYRGFLEAGDHTFSWYGLDDRGRSMSGGVYVVQVRSGMTQDAKRILLLR